MVRKPSWIIVGIGLMLGLWNAAFIEAASPVEDSAQLFNNFDRDGSGVISQTELGGFTAFARYDQNGDGELSQAEFVGGRTADRRAAAAGGATEASWKLLDWNNDGFLSGTELDGRWDVFDADGDGRVYKKEFLGGSTPAPAPPRTDFIPQPDNAPGAADAAKSLWGANFAAARKGDFFTFFHLEPLPDVVLLEAGTRHDFRPKGPAFRDAVLVQVLVDRQQRVSGIDVLVSRSFIDSPQTAPFARDLVKSVLRDFLPAADRARMQTLINEVEYGAPNRVQLGGPAPPPLPNPPTAGYLAYLGRRDQFEQKLGTVQLVLWNGNEDGDEKLLRISIQPQTDDEEKA